MSSASRRTSSYFYYPKIRHLRLSRGEGTYRGSSIIFIAQAKFSHLIVNDFERNHQVGEDDLAYFLSFVKREPIHMYQAHLFQDGRFSRFTGTCYVEY